ncbi:hypothetical protein Sa4125_20270 [Aureimonas sp. SA4125]|uniref:DUF6105 family protein n=1 Tax=Aureimonas sp. SA4125 TaxID=2826993 RepID=UPI001CC3EF2B|nr:DUF6105 family protein [Aureimonas sp. SA4125]BDA84485.1 hypothetical protein Sa4125_20270 [Aureimonas sp. SA4125]
MKLLGFWLGTMAVFWLWFCLSSLDLGLPLLTRSFHDDTMLVYGWALGVEPALVPWFFAKAFAIDGALVAAIVAFRKRRTLSVKLAAATANIVTLLRRLESTRADRVRPAE